MINLRTKFEVCNSSRYEDMNDDGICYKKLCYRRRTARRDVSVEFFPSAVQHCR